MCGRVGVLLSTFTLKLSAPRWHLVGSLAEWHQTPHSSSIQIQLSDVISLSLSLSLCNVCHWQALSSPGSGGAVPAQHRWRGEITHLLVPSPPTRGNYQMWQLQLWKITSQRRNVASLPPIYILPLLPLSSWVRWEEECPTNIITLTLAISISAPPQSSPVNYLIIVPDPISKCIFIILSAS